MAATIPMDTEYLQSSVGPALSAALAEAALQNPDDPVDFVGNYLMHYVQKKEEEAQLRQLLRDDEIRQAENAERIRLAEAERAARLDLQKQEEEEDSRALSSLFTSGSGQAFDRAVLNVLERLKKRVAASGVYVGELVKGPRADGGDEDDEPLDEDDEGEEEEGEEEDEENEGRAADGALAEGSEQDCIVYSMATDGHGFMAGKRLRRGQGRSFEVLRKPQRQVKETRSEAEDGQNDEGESSQNDQGGQGDGGEQRPGGEEDEGDVTQKEFSAQSVTSVEEKGGQDSALAPEAEEKQALLDVEAASGLPFVYVPSVLHEKNLHFFRFPLSGSFLALSLSYKSLMHAGSLAAETENDADGEAGRLENGVEEQDTSNGEVGAVEGGDQTTKTGEEADGGRNPEHGRGPTETKETKPYTARTITRKLVLALDTMGSLKGVRTGPTPANALKRAQQAGDLSEAQIADCKLWAVKLSRALSQAEKRIFEEEADLLWRALEEGRRLQEALSAAGGEAEGQEEGEGEEGGGGEVEAEGAKEEGGAEEEQHLQGQEDSTEAAKEYTAACRRWCKATMAAREAMKTAAAILAEAEVAAGDKQSLDKGALSRACEQVFAPRLPPSAAVAAAWLRLTSIFISAAENNKVNDDDGDNVAVDPSTKAILERCRCPVTGRAQWSLVRHYILQKGVLGSVMALCEEVANGGRGRKAMEKSILCSNLLKSMRRCFSQQSLVEVDVEKVRDKAPLAAPLLVDFVEASADLIAKLQEKETEERALEEQRAQEEAEQRAQQEAEAGEQAEKTED